MTPQIQYLLALAQRAGNTPAGQRLMQMAERAIDATRRLETRWPALPRGPGGAFPARTGADKIPLAPISRGMAGTAGVGSVAAGSGQFEGVRDRIMPSSASAGSVPQSLWSELDARSAGPPADAPPLTIPSSNRIVQSDINHDRPDLPDDALGGWPVVERALAVARREASPEARSAPPPRPREETSVMRGDYQSMNALADGPERGYGARVIQGDRINWGDADSAADFFRADRAMRDMGRANGGRVDLMQMANEAMNLQMARRQAEEGMKAQSRAPRMADGGGVPSASGAPGNDKVLEHAMAIIRHLITKG
jgi:hypothetical protein